MKKIGILKLLQVKNIFFIIAFSVAALATVLSCASLEKRAAGAGDNADSLIDEKPYEYVSMVGVTDKRIGMPSWNYYHHIDDPVVLTEYPDVLLPYAEELERVNLDLDMDYEITKVFSSDEEAEYIIEFITSMSIEEFRDFVYEGYEDEIEYSRSSYYRNYLDETTEDDTTDVAENSGADGEVAGVKEIIGFDGAVKHRGGFWYFADNETAESDIHYYPNNEPYGDTPGVIPYGDISPSSNVGVLTNKDSTNEVPDSRIGIYKGDGWVYHVYSCD